MRDAYARAIAACRRHGKHVGVGGLASRPDLIAEYVRMGARYVSTGTDIGFLLGAATQRAQAGAGDQALIPIVQKDGRPGYLGEREATIKAWFGDDLETTTSIELTVR